MRNRWFTPRAVLLHMAVVVVAGGCLTAAWWQINRARSGNWLSYAYAVEWPVFAIVAVIAWWQLIHDDDREIVRLQRGDADASGATNAVSALPVRRVEEESDELRAYNDYLQELAASSGRKTWRNPRGV